MPKRSAGILLFQFESGELRVLLVHPGGPFWAGRDDGAWSIPKGELAEGADPLSEAVREFEEETGMKPAGSFLELRPVRQRGGKMVHAWALRGDFDPVSLRSSTFSLEWPPHSGRVGEFPEVDRASWFPIDRARQKINAGQAPLLDQLVERLAWQAG
ncbi:MAG: NUDIX domain-containing protein [Gemmatimonadota bacterium]